jgi:hypothetical protein
MKKRSSKRVTAYVQGRHHKKPVRIYIRENEREREREGLYASAIDVGDEREDQ